MEANTITNSDIDYILGKSLDMEKTGWIKSLGEDLIIVHNPTFEFQCHHPYRTRMSIAVICERGTASGSIDLQPYTVSENGLLVILGGQIIESFDKSGDYRSTYIFMSESFLSRLNIGDSYSIYKSIRESPYTQFSENFFALQDYINMVGTMIDVSDNMPNAEESIVLLTKAFFLMLGGVIHMEAVQNDMGSRDSEVTNGFFSLVKSDYREHRDVEYYADRMNLSAKYLSSIIKKTSGKTALKWIEDYVINDAKARLFSSADTIQQICYELNFPSQSFFGQYFKRVTGMSPSEYRRHTRTDWQQKGRKG